MPPSGRSGTQCPRCSAWPSRGSCGSNWIRLQNLQNRQTIVRLREDMTSERPVEITPSAAALIESLRGLGYSPETAIADLIDNSIAANAVTIELELNWND